MFLGLDHEGLVEFGYMELQGDWLQGDWGSHSLSEKKKKEEE